MLNRDRLVRLVLALAAVAGAGALVHAQATAQNHLAWNQAAADLPTASAYTYGYYTDGATVRQLLTATCTGTATPFACTAPLPAFTPGSHTITIDAGDVAGTSPLSAPLSFTFVVIPLAPAGLRITP